MMASLKKWRIVGACVTGTRHERSGEECGDAMGYTFLSDGSFLCAVADGAGSALLGKEGAQCAIETALAYTAEAVAQSTSDKNSHFYRNVLEMALQTVRSTLETRVQNDLTLRDFATTLLFTLVTPEWIAAFQVGDGAIVVQRAEGMLQTITVAAYEEYINETHFITDPDYLAHAHYVVEPSEDIYGIAMLTDGLQMLALEIATHTAYPPFFLPFFTFASQNEKNEVELARELVDFLASDRVSKRTDDDKTLLLAMAIDLQIRHSC